MRRSTVVLFTKYYWVINSRSEKHVVDLRISAGRGNCGSFIGRATEC
jgi:hypothetical protein